MIADRRMVTGQTQDVLDGQRRGAKEVGLQHIAVLVSTRHMKNCLQSHPLDECGHCQPTHVGRSERIVADMNGIEETNEWFHPFQITRCTGAVRRVYLGCHDETSRPKLGFKSTSLAQLP